MASITESKADIEALQVAVGNFAFILFLILILLVFGIGFLGWI
ncbi:MAG: hypothetical protein ACYC0Q_00280 [Eubacteriales bacterium]